MIYTDTYIYIHTHRTSRCIPFYTHGVFFPATWCLTRLAGPPGRTIPPGEVGPPGHTALASGPWPDPPKSSATPVDR